MELPIVRVLFLLTASMAAVCLIVTGLIGYQLPAELSLDAAAWRRGVWTGEVILIQVGLGIVLLAAACYVAVHLTRRRFRNR